MMGVQRLFLDTPTQAKVNNAEGIPMQQWISLLLVISG
jgi:hypothetical protein